MTVPPMSPLWNAWNARINWRKWVEEDLGLSLEDVASVNFSRDIKNVTLPRLRRSMSVLLPEGQITLTTKNGIVYTATLDWDTNAVITSEQEQTT